MYRILPVFSLKLFSHVRMSRDGDAESIGNAGKYKIFWCWRENIGTFGDFDFVETIGNDRKNKVFWETTLKQARKT